jgi:hypothetical protein
MAGMAPEWWNKPWPFGVLLFGLLMLLLAVMGTFTGTAYGTYGTKTVRAKDPVNYWLTLAMEYLAGAFFIWWGANGLPRL